MEENQEYMQQEALSSENAPYQPASGQPVPEPAPDIRTARRRFSRAGLSMFFVAVFSVALVVAFALILRVVRAALPVIDPYVQSILNFVPMYGIAIPLGLLVMGRFSPDSSQPERLGAGRFWKLMLMCFPLAYLGNFLGSLLAAILSGGRAVDPVGMLVDEMNLFEGIFVVLIGPLIEELFFRKALIDRLSRYGEKLAILFSSVCFALFHQNVYQFFYTLGFGLILAYVYTRTRRLRYSYAMHAIFNFLGGIVPYFVMSRMDDELIDALDSMDLSVLTPELLERSLPSLAVFGVYALMIVVLFIAGALMLILGRRQFVFRAADEELPPREGRRAAFANVGFILAAACCVVLALINLYSFA